eukprot:g15616.t1
MKFLSVSFFYSVSGVDGAGIRLRKEITSGAPQAPPQQNFPKDEERPEVLSQTPDFPPKEGADEQIKPSDILISEGLARAVGEKADSGRFAGLETCLAVWQEVTHPVILAAIATSEGREEAELQGQTRTGRSCLGGPPTNAYRWLFDQNATSMELEESFSPDERAARAFGTACLFHLRTADVAESWGTRAGALAAQAAVWESEVLNFDPGLSCRVLLWQLHVVLLKIVMRHLWEDGGGSALGGFDLRHTEGTGSTTGPRSLNKVQFALEFFHGGHFKIYDDGYLFHMLTNVLKFRIPTTQELFSSSSARDVVRRVDRVLPYSWTLEGPPDSEGRGGVGDHGESRRATSGTHGARGRKVDEVMLGMKEDKVMGTGVHWRSRGYTGRAVLYGVAYEEAGEEVGTFRAFTYLQTELAPWYTMKTTANPLSSLLRGINFHHTHVAAQFFALCRKAGGNRGKQVGLLTGYQPGDRRGKKEEEEERFGDGVRGSARCGSEHVDSLPLVIQPPLDAVGRVDVGIPGRPAHSALEELLYVDGALQSGEELGSCEWRTRDS